MVTDAPGRHIPQRHTSRHRPRGLALLNRPLSVPAALLLQCLPATDANRRIPTLACRYTRVSPSSCRSSSRRAIRTRRRRSPSSRHASIQMWTSTATSASTFSKRSGRLCTTCARSCCRFRACLAVRNAPLLECVARSRRPAARDPPSSPSPLNPLCHGRPES